MISLSVFPFSFFLDTEKYSWLENYAGSSGLNEVINTSAISGIPVSQLEMDRGEATVCFCPLLADPASYIPDTVNLTEDHEARYLLSGYLPQTALLPI